MNARITFIAHAATEAQRHAAFPLDEPVTERAMQRFSASQWIAPAATNVWSAPELRARQTAQLLGLSAVASDKLRDCDYGRWGGRKMEEMQAEDPDGLLSWLTAPDASPHGGESIEALIARIGDWLAEQSNLVHTVAITHPAVIRAAIVSALRLPAQAFWRFDVAPLTQTDMRFNQRAWTLRCVGCPLLSGDIDER